jgi:hypothetical protein
VTDNSVNHQGLFFALDANLADPIEHEAIPKIALRALVDQDPAQSPTRRLLNDIPIQAFQSRRRIHRITNRRIFESIRSAHTPGYNRSGVNPNPHPDRRETILLMSEVEPMHLPLHG